MIRIAMCDDETMFLQTYQKKVSELFQEHNVDCKIDTYTDARRFLEDCEKTSYDLIFLDIDMPGLSGIQLASKFRDKGLDTTLVFVPAMMISCLKHFVTMRIVLFARINLSVIRRK